MAPLHQVLLVAEVAPTLLPVEDGVAVEPQEVEVRLTPIPLQVLAIRLLQLLHLALPPLQHEERVAVPLVLEANNDAGCRTKIMENLT